MVHFDAFDAFSADALVHFGSGIQVQPQPPLPPFKMEQHSNMNCSIYILCYMNAHTVIAAFSLNFTAESESITIFIVASR